MVLASVVILTVLTSLAGAQTTTSAEMCEGSGEPPVPVAVEVTAVPIVVTSTTADYFVLYASHDLNEDTTLEVPVAVILGEDGTTTLSENVAALPVDRYRVEKYQVATPADIDGDCLDDITELADMGAKNPVNPADALAPADGVLAIPDHEAYNALTTSAWLGGLLLRSIKFLILDVDSERPRVYFLNGNTHRAHLPFLNDVLGLELSASQLKGDIAYDRDLVAPDGSMGVYHFEWGRRRYDFGTIERAYTALAASMPLLENNLAFWISREPLPYHQPYMALYRASRINLVFDDDIFPDVTFLALNPGVGYGLLRQMDPDERPGARDIVLYETLPNELPPVAGVISTVPQTPLSHVNLRAVQNGVPNAYIRDALEDTDLTPLLDGYVRYEVTETGWTMRAATSREVEGYYAASRPPAKQTPQRDLSVTTITPLSEIGFDDWDAFGVKAANVAVLGTLGFPAGTIPEGGTVPIGGTVPDGFAIPFYFYDEFMTKTALGEETWFGYRGAGRGIGLAAETTLAAAVAAILAHAAFYTDFDLQDEMLDDLRDAIKDAEAPQWMRDALTTMHAAFPGRPVAALPLQHQQRGPAGL